MDLLDLLEHLLGAPLDVGAWGQASGIRSKGSGMVFQKEVSGLGTGVR